MHMKLEAAATITAALLRDYKKPTTEQLVELLTQSLEAIDEAIGLENRRNAKKQAELKTHTVAARR